MDMFTVMLLASSALAAIAFIYPYAIYPLVLRLLPTFEPNAEAELPEQPSLAEDDTEAEKKIKGILDEYIRPAVEQDGGAITFHSFDEGKVKVLLQGSCSGCPSSTITLKAGIENLLKRMVPEVEEVIAEGV